MAQGAARLLFILLLLLGLAWSGCLEPEPSPDGAPATARALYPEEGRFGTALGRPLPEPQGDLDLVMAYAIESPDPERSAMVHELYNYKDHLVPDESPGDGLAARWLYQFHDDANITFQHIATTEGEDHANWGAYWYWLPTHWSLADPSRPVTDWQMDSDAVAAIAADADEQLPHWGDPTWDHVYLLYTPEGHNETHWLVTLSDLGGAERHHLVIRDRDGAIVPLDEVHPVPVERDTVQGSLAQPNQEAEFHHVEPMEETVRLVLRVTPEVPRAVADYGLAVESDRWQEVDRSYDGDALVVVLEAVERHGLAHVHVSLEGPGPVQQYTLDWCSDGLFIDVLDRAVDRCDDLLP